MPATDQTGDEGTILHLRQLVRSARPEYPENHVSYVARVMYEPLAELVSAIGDPERYRAAVARIDAAMNEIGRYFAERPIGTSKEDKEYL